MPVDQTEVALIFDFDITISPHYMQKPIFDAYELSEGEISVFWNEDVAKLKQAGYDDEHAYIHALIRRFPDLSNHTLRELGANLEFYPGFPGIIDRLQEITEQREYGIDGNGPRLGVYVVSSGLEEMIEGCAARDKLKRVWGCRIAEENSKLTFPMETISHTTKTQKLFLINKGFLKPGEESRVNDFMPPERRPVPFEHMVYVGDGPSDVPSFSTLKRQGGRTIAVFRPGDYASFADCYRLAVEAKRVDSMHSADYQDGSDLSLALEHHVRMTCTRIHDSLAKALKQGVVEAPHHSSGDSAPPLSAREGSA